MINDMINTTWCNWDFQNRPMAALAVKALGTRILALGKTVKDNDAEFVLYATGDLES